MDEWKELMAMFKPLDEEEQKDLLFIVLDCMDFHSEQGKKAKTEKEREINFHAFSSYEMIAHMMTEDPEWLKKIGSSMRKMLLDHAREERTRYEKEKDRRKS